MKQDFIKKSLFITRQLFFVFFTFVLALVIIEGLLRLSNGLRKIDDIPYVLVDGLRVFTPNIDTIVTGGAFTPIHVKTNAEGYASPDYPVLAVSNTIRIAFLGNSFTRGFEVDYDKKFTSLVQKNLSDIVSLNHTRYETMNFGIGGYGFIDQMFAYERYVKKYHPQHVILVIFPRMDFSTAKPYLSDEKYLTETPLESLSGDRLLNRAPLNIATTVPPVRSLEITRFTRRIIAGIAERIYQASLNQKSVLYKPLTILYTTCVRLGVINPIVAEAASTPDDDRSYFDSADIKRIALMRFTANLAKKIGETVRQDGGKFSLVFIPSYWGVDNKYTQQLVETYPTKYDISLPVKIFQQVIGTEFPILDLAGRLTVAINDEHTQVFIRDTGHFTAEGHKIVAQSITDFLKSIR